MEGHAVSEYQWPVGVEIKKIVIFFYKSNRITIGKSINTNGNIKGIFLLVNFLGILPAEVFPRYIPRELQWETKLKQSKRKK
jgi:hypothetical protein